MLKTIAVEQWQPDLNNANRLDALAAIENGSVLFLPQLRFALNPEEHSFLSPHYSDGKAKNISFNPKTQQVRGVGALAPAEHQSLQAMLQRFASYATTLIQSLFPEYQSALEIGRTSFRPVEIAGRKSPSYRKDDTRLHVDAFPASPNQGRRILRVFSNVNPYGQPRVWRIGESFEQVAKRFLPQIRFQSNLKANLYRRIGITKGLRTDYDHLMLELHNRMKADLQYQKIAEQICVDLPAQTTWLVQTDQVSHAAMSGQYLLEQTFYLPVHAMQNPHLSPLKVLERLTGRELV